jgi:GxxExxY protein
MAAQMHSNKQEAFPFKEECYRIIGCCMEVHNELGCGFLEAVYQEALEIVFMESGLPFVREKVLDIHFRQRILNKKYVADFICFDEVIVELKAAESLTDQDLAQVLNYLKATGKKLGLLVNFGTTKLQYKRVIL